MRKNVASQKIGAQLVSATDGSAFTGSVTVAVTGDAGTQATGSVGSGACAHEGGGYHTYSPAQAETNYDLVAFTFSGTGAVPVTIQVYTLPTTGVLAPTTAGRTLVVDAAGLADANAVKVGPTGSGTAQTARDIGASVLLSSGTGTGQISLSSGVVSANATHWGGTAVASALVRANVIQWTGTNVATPNTAGVPKVDLTLINGSAASAVTPQTIDLGTDDRVLVSADTHTSGETNVVTTNSRLTSARAGYIDKLNVTGVLAHTDNANAFKADVSGLITTSGYTAPDNAGIAAAQAAAEAAQAAAEGIPAAPTDEQVAAKVQEVLADEHGDGSWEGGGGGNTGSGDVPVDHDTPTADAMRVTDSDGDGIDGVRVVAYVKAAYDASPATADPQAETVTKADGRWTDALNLDEGVQYLIRFTKSGIESGSATVTPEA